MKKRIVSLLLVLCILCTCGLFASCNKVTAYAVVSQAVANTNKLDDLEARMDMKISMSAMGMDISIPMKADIRLKGLQGENPVYSSKTSTTVLGQTEEVELYHEGDWLYCNVAGITYKTNSAEGKSEYDYTDTVQESLKELPEDLLKDIAPVKNEDGSYTVTVSLSGEEFEKLYKDIVDSAAAGTGNSDVKITVSDAEVSFVVKGRYVSSFDMKFKMNFEIQGVSTTAEVEVHIEFVEPGKEVTVTPPDGYLTFGEKSDTAESGLLQQAIENTTKLDDMELNSKMEMTMSLTGMNMTIPMDIIFKAVDVHGSKPTVYTKQSTSVMGQNTETEEYREGDWTYYIEDGESYKVNTAQDGTENDFLGVILGILNGLPEISIEGVEPIQNKDGSYTFEISSSNDQLQTVYKKLFEGILGQEDMPENDIKISEAECSITVKDHYIASMHMKFKTDMTQEEMESSVGITFDVSYVNPGQKVTITPPEGYQNFEEMPPVDL